MLSPGSSSSSIPVLLKSSKFGLQRQGTKEITDLKSHGHLLSLSINIPSLSSSAGTARPSGVYPISRSPNIESSIGDSPIRAPRGSASGTYQGLGDGEIITSQIGRPAQLSGPPTVAQPFTALLRPLWPIITRVPFALAHHSPPDPRRRPLQKFSHSSHSSLSAQFLRCATPLDPATTRRPPPHSTASTCVNESHCGACVVLVICGRGCSCWSKRANIVVLSLIHI